MARSQLSLILNRPRLGATLHRLRVSRGQRVRNDRRRLRQSSKREPLPGEMEQVSADCNQAWGRPSLKDKTVQGFTGWKETTRSKEVAEA